MTDNIDLGKTHEYFRWIVKEYDGPGQVKGRPRFVMKTDDDVGVVCHVVRSHQTLLVMPNIVSSFRNLDCRENVYWGTRAGRSNHFGDYMRGLAYAMSWPLVGFPCPIQCNGTHVRCRG